MKTYERSVFSVGSLFNFFPATVDHKFFLSINTYLVSSPETHDTAHVLTSSRKVSVIFLRFQPNFNALTSTGITLLRAFRPLHSMQNVHGLKPEIRILGCMGYYNTSSSLSPTA
jgi:hypothetical protein